MQPLCHSIDVECIPFLILLLLKIKIIDKDKDQTQLQCNMLCYTIMVENLFCAKRMLFARVCDTNSFLLLLFGILTSTMKICEVGYYIFDDTHMRVYSYYKFGKNKVEHKNIKNQCKLSHKMTFDGTQITNPKIFRWRVQNIMWACEIVTDSRRCRRRHLRRPD